MQDVGKTIFTINLAEQIKNKKVLIIEINSKNQDIKILKNKIHSKNQDTENLKNNIYFQNQDTENLKNKMHSKNQQNEIEEIYKNFYEKGHQDKKTQNSKEGIIVLNKKVHLFSTKVEEISELEIIKIIKMWKENYEVIIIDMEKENEQNNTSLFEEIDKIIFLTEANILQIKKSKTYLEEKINQYKIDKEKINIVFNKTTKESFSINILKNALKEYNLLGKINNIENCNLLINHNMNQSYLDKKIKAQYQRIGNEILKNKNTKNYYLNKINAIQI